MVDIILIQSKKVVILRANDEFQPDSSNICNKLSTQPNIQSVSLQKDMKVVERPSP